MEDCSSFRDVLLACINDELVEENYAPWMEEYQTRIAAEDSMVVEAALRLCKEFHDHDPQRFQQIMSICHDLHITKENICVAYSSICEGVMHWSKVIALLVFARTMSVECYRRNDTKMVSYIVEWTCEFVCRFIQEWIKTNGGWIGFVEHFTPRDTLSWKSLYDTVKDVVIEKLALKSF
ncbi:hypothetical protein CHS0354_026013 [Potamilus streckersoni]|uniref:Bcl-2 Bcl-2 homology region 1-3 domain-containing protein n=1 Tax=Potamilus streckersoni TaxID=2493646 RepID=A0AAE0SB51_9BIVA|nr:hypothetical protein CHS0354_026013 [Potamilus streckersoni]